MFTIFFLTDQVEKGNVHIEYCPTDEMVGDFHTKPLQGEKFRKFRAEILGQSPARKEKTSRKRRKVVSGPPRQ
jgi:hypothetical protein